MTAAGIIFVPLALLAFLFRPRLLVPLLIFSAVLQACAVVNVGELGLSPYYFVAALIALRYFCLILTNLATPLPLYEYRFLFLFFLWAAFGCVLFPLIFSGTKVFNPHEGLEAVLESSTHLQWSAANLTPAIYLTLNVIAIAYAWTEKPEWKHIRLALIAGAVLFVSVVGLQWLSVLTGIELPFDLLNNNAGYRHATLNVDEGFSRTAGTFAEPSVTGAYVAGLFGFALYRFLSEGKGIWALIGASLLAAGVASGSGLLAMLALSVILAVRFFPFRRPTLFGPIREWFHAPRVRRWSVLAGLILAGLGIVIWSPTVRQLLINETVGRRDSYSLLVRSAADMFGLRTILDTYGLGLGLGSLRTSSFAVTMLATVGIPGVILFTAVLWQAMQRCQSPALRWMLGGIVLAQCAGVPDLSLTILWTGILTCSLGHAVTANLDLQLYRSRAFGQQLHRTSIRSIRQL